MMARRAFSDNWIRPQRERGGSSLSQPELHLNSMSFDRGLGLRKDAGLWPILRVFDWERIFFIPRHEQVFIEVRHPPGL